MQSVQKMLPYLAAAAGHNHYTKSAWLYLQHMITLEASNEKVYNDLCSGHQVIRRSDRVWAGISPDMVIEQELMRSLKSVGGLTRGTGLKERKRLVWLLGMPACAAINVAMQSLTGVSMSTNEQHQKHKETGKKVKKETAKTQAKSYSTYKIAIPSLAGLAYKV